MKILKRSCPADWPDGRFSPGFALDNSFSPGGDFGAGIAAAPNTFARSERMKTKAADVATKLEGLQSDIYK